MTDADLSLHSADATFRRPNGSFSGRGETINLCLVKIARFVKPLFANMHHVHRVHAASWVPAEAKRCMPAPRRLHWIASSVMVM